jgi:hypothetical protein
MRATYLFCASWVVAIAAISPAPLFGDYYDSFNDGWYARDPNDPAYDANDPYWTDPNNAVGWDVDNPDWLMMQFVGSDYYQSAADGWLRLHVSAHAILPIAFLGTMVDDGDHDPNTSATWYNNSAPHYMVGKMKFNPALPNSGGVWVFMHASVDTWETYVLDYNSYDGYLMFCWVSGLTYQGASSKVMNPPPDEPNGFWFAFQFDPNDPNGTGDPNDPNNHWLRGAIWEGGKFDWNGQWTIQARLCNNPTWPAGTYPYWTEGQCGFGPYVSEWTGPTLTGDMKYDNIECRWGAFTNVSHTLSLLVKTIDKGTVTIDPDLLDDSNNIDPNDYTSPMDPNLLRRYTSGTEVVLVAEPVEGKAFRAWKIYDPNYPGDANHAVEDSNSVLYLTMDADYEVEAIFKCGSAGMMPVAGVVLAALGLAVMVRRLR